MIHRLPRSEGPPVELDGDLICSVKSPMFLKSTAKRFKYCRWFEVEIYRSLGGVFAAAVHYRFTGALPNEMQTDEVWIAPSWQEIVTQLDGFDPTALVDGFPPGDNWIDHQQRLMANVSADWLALADDVMVALRNCFAKPQTIC